MLNRLLNQLSQIWHQKETQAPEPSAEKKLQSALEKIRKTKEPKTRIDKASVAVRRYFQASVEQPESKTWEELSESIDRLRISKNKKAIWKNALLGLSQLEYAETYTAEETEKTINFLLQAIQDS